MINYWKTNYNDLLGKSELFCNAFYSTTHPPEVIEAIAANLTILKSPTVLHQRDGKLWSWEGLNSPDPVKASEGSLSSDYSAEARALLQKEGPKYQYGTGCLSDGILGAWIGEVCGLSNVVASHLMMMGETEKGLEIPHFVPINRDSIRNDNINN